MDDELSLWQLLDDANAVGPSGVVKPGLSGLLPTSDEIPPIPGQSDLGIRQILIDDELRLWRLLDECSDGPFAQIGILKPTCLWMSEKTSALWIALGLVQP